MLPAFGINLRSSVFGLPTSRGKLPQIPNMKKLLIIISLFFLNKGLAQTGSLSGKYVLVIHGGAGTILKKQMTPEKEKAYQAALDKALETGYAILEKGGTALDAVEAAVRSMEDDPLFNSGKGAVFTAEGKNELDAAIMNGKTLAAGSVAGVTTIRNPISAARAVMEKSPHVMLAGKGAETFAKEQGLQIVDPSYFFTEERWKGLQRAKAQDSIKRNEEIAEMLKKIGNRVDTTGVIFPIMIDGRKINSKKELDAFLSDTTKKKSPGVKPSNKNGKPQSMNQPGNDKTVEGLNAIISEMMKDTSSRMYKELQRGGLMPDSIRKKYETSSSLKQPENRDDKYGTVGAVALDRQGNLAAATSTGGMTNKKWNRIGDAPIIGAGTYANNATVAISGTGWGEYFIRLVMAKSISDMMEFGKWSLADAANEMIMKRLPALGGDGGLIAVDKDGNVALPFCTEGMYRGFKKSDGTKEIKIYKED
jgi:L-asparaginase / beta-aspartyl-peptidase